MAAGLGFKDFVTGEVLTAADVDGYLMQGVWVFASAAARDSAVTSPQEGNFAYLKDTNVTTYYTGSAWANLDTTGMTNPMTTTGDTIYSSSGSTPARLAIGSTGNVLTVAGGVPSWAAPAGGSDNFTLINAGGTSLTSATEITVSGISGKNKLLIYCIGASTTSSYFGMGLRLNADSTANNYTGFGINNSSSAGAQYNQAIGSIGYWDIFYTGTPASSNGNFVATIEGTNTSGIKPIQVASTAGGSAPEPYNFTGYYAGSSAISSITLISSSGNFDAGTVYVYGA